jgi:hypothetical protein
MNEEEQKGEWRVAPISLDDIRFLFNFLSGGDIRIAHSYIFKDFNHPTLILINPVDNNSECGLCRKPIRVGEGFKFSKSLFNRCEDYDKNGHFEEHGMVFFSHYRHLHLEGLH